MNNQPGSSAGPGRRFLLAVVGLAIFAWLIREYFVLVTIVDSPIRGDIREYVAYAWNMLHSSTFSHVWPGTGTPVPDAYRGPGYPAFLALWMWIAPDGWYLLSLHAQSLAGALTVAATTLLARHWLAPKWALAAGLLLALWPHHIAATGTLLAEVLFGCLLIVALLLSAEALKRRNAWLAASSGVLFSGAALTSLVSLPYPLFLAALFWRERLPRAACALLALALLAPAMWAMRDVPAPGADTPGRMEMNLIQGSWPQYHVAFHYRNVDPVARDIMASMSAEIALLATDPKAALATVSARLGRDPGRYLAWYLMEKPFLLWDWDIRIGAGDVYFHPPHKSPLDSNMGLRTIKQVLKAANPLIFGISALGALALMVGWLGRRPWASPAAVSVAAFCIYITALHVVFQAEPRYAIAYRSLQLLMLVTAIRGGIGALTTAHAKIPGRARLQK